MSDDGVCRYSGGTDGFDSFEFKEGMSFQDVVFAIIRVELHARLSFEAALRAYGPAIRGAAEVTRGA